MLGEKHPRVSGEYKRLIRMTGYEGETPPRERGIPNHGWKLRFLVGNTPA